MAHNEYDSHGQSHSHYIDAPEIPLKDSEPSADGTRPRANENNIGKMLYIDTGATRVDVEFVEAGRDPVKGKENDHPQLDKSQYMDTGLNRVENPESYNRNQEGGAPV